MTTEPVAHRGYFDGSCSGRLAGFGFVLAEQVGGELHCVSKGSGRIEEPRQTNNVAEYMALMALLNSALALKVSRLEVFGDSQLVINQMKGEYKVKAKHLQPYHKKAKKLSEQFSGITFSFIPREQNKQADKLSKLALQPE